MLEIKKVSKKYGIGNSEVVALNSINLKIEKGEFISIVGPSGSGKSTLLNILSGIDVPTEGEVYVDKKNICHMKDEKISKFRRKNFGFIFQSFNLIPALSVRENIIMPVLLDRKKVDEKYFNELVEGLGLSERLNHMPHELSGGQQQRVAIARALIAKPNIVFADEPTGNLDSQSGKKVINILKDTVRKYGNTLIIITHDDKVAKIADKKISIIDGSIVEVSINQ